MMFASIGFVPGVPGGPELLIIFFILALVGVPIVAAVLLILLVRSRSSDGGRDRLHDRVENLERRVERLQTERDAGAERDAESDRDVESERDDR